MSVDRPVGLKRLLEIGRSADSGGQMELGVNDGHGKVKALGNRHQAIRDFEKLRLVICRC